MCFIGLLIWCLLVKKQGRYRRCYLEAAVTFQLVVSTLWKLTKDMEFSKALFSPHGVSAAAILLVLSCFLFFSFLTNQKESLTIWTGGSGYDPPRWFGEGVIMPQEDEEEEDSYGNEDEREI